MNLKWRFPLEAYSSSAKKYFVNYIISLHHQAIILPVNKLHVSHINRNTTLQPIIFPCLKEGLLRVVFEKRQIVLKKRFGKKPLSIKFFLLFFGLIAFSFDIDGWKDFLWMTKLFCLISNLVQISLNYWPWVWSIQMLGIKSNDSMVKKVIVEEIHMKTRECQGCW